MTSTPAIVRGRGLSRAAIVARALEVGTADGLDAVSLRRLATEFGVTPMALYRHVRDKQDLINAMTEVVLEDFDLTVGIEASMSWSERARRAMLNYKDQMDARPLSLPLSVAYAGDGPPAFWRMLEDLLAILLDAGFERRQAIILMRVLSNVLAGYLLLLRPAAAGPAMPRTEREVEIVRTRVKLALLTLPPAVAPTLASSADDVADVWISDPDRWWRDTVDLIVAGLEGLRARTTGANA